MSPLAMAAWRPLLCVAAGAVGGGVVSLALRSGQATPRSGIVSSGALGSSSAGSGGGGVEGTACADNPADTNAIAAAAHSSRAAPSREPRPIIRNRDYPALLNG